MAHHIVVARPQDFRDVPELDVLDLAKTGGKPVPSHPGYVTAPKAFPLAKEPTAPVFRPTGYPWVVLATDEGKAQLKTSGSTALFKAPARLRTGSLPLHCLDPWALHQRVRSHNWDDGHELLYEALRSPWCDLATALYIYWAGGAGWYRQWARREDVPLGKDAWDLVHHVEKRVLGGELASGWVWFDPVEEDRFYEDLAHEFVRELPAVMYRATGPRPQRTVPPLHAAASAGDLEAVRTLLDAGADPTEAMEDDRGTTPLRRAVRYRHGAVAAELIRRMPQVSRWDVPVALRLPDPAVLSALAPRVEPAQLLAVAARLGRVDAAERALRAGAPVDGHDALGKTALHTAAEAGHLQTCRFLLASGASVDALDRRGDRTALEKAAQAGHVEICRLLLDKGATRVEAALRWSLVSAMPDDRANLPLMELAIERGAPLNDALALSAANAYEEPFDRVLALGADVDHVAWGGNRPLHLACAVNEYSDYRRDQRLAIVGKLVAAGADVSAKDAEGRTPAERAREAGFLEALPLLGS